MLVKLGSSSPIFGVKTKKYLSCHHLDIYAWCPPTQKYIYIYMFRAKTVVFTVFQAHFVYIYYIYTIPWIVWFCDIFSSSPSKARRKISHHPFGPLLARMAPGRRIQCSRAVNLRKITHRFWERKCCDLLFVDHWKKGNPNKSSPIMDNYGGLMVV